MLIAQLSKMTSGFAILRNMSWPRKKKKKSLAVSGLQKRMSSSTVKQSKKSRQPGLEDPFSYGGLDILAPSSSSMEFKYSWPVDGFVKQVRGDFRTQNRVKLGKPSQQWGRGSQILSDFPNFEVGKWFL